MSQKLGAKITTALVDFSGTLYIGEQAVGEAVKALTKLRSLVKHVRFVTNATKESTDFLYGRLISLGFELEPSEIFSSLTAARKLVERENLRPFLLLEDDAMEVFQGISTENPNAVVVGSSPSKFNYAALNKAFHLLVSSASAPLIGMYKGRYSQKPDGLLHLGPGPFVAALEYATEKRAIVVGKPESQFFMDAIRDCAGVAAENCVMIGDDVRDDVSGAQAAGMRGILVKTGKYRSGDEKKVSPQPWFVADDFAHAVSFLERNIKSSAEGSFLQSASVLKSKSEALLTMEAEL